MNPSRVGIPLVHLPSLSWVPDIGQDRAERPPRGLQVSVGCVTFPQCRARSRTPSSERMMLAGASALPPRSGRYLSQSGPAEAAR